MIFVWSGGGGVRFVCFMCIRFAIRGEKPLFSRIQVCAFLISFFVLFLYYLSLCDITQVIASQLSEICKRTPTIGGSSAYFTANERDNNEIFTTRFLDPFFKCCLHDIFYRIQEFFFPFI